MNRYYIEFDFEHKIMEDETVTDTGDSFVTAKTKDKAKEKIELLLRDHPNIVDYSVEHIEEVEGDISEDTDLSTVQ